MDVVKKSSVRFGCCCLLTLHHYFGISVEMVFFYSFKYNFKVGNRNNNRSHAQMRHIFECARLELSECCDIIYRLQAIQLWFRLTLPFIRYLFRCVWVHLCANTHTQTHLNTNVRTTRKKMYTGENLHQKMIETLSKSVGWSYA